MSAVIKSKLSLAVCRSDRYIRERCLVLDAEAIRSCNMTEHFFCSGITLVGVRDERAVDAWRN